MLTRFETKCNRVKGLCFHSERPWILASLSSGVIQLWDYRMGTLIDRFDEHDGPVRGVHFHRSQPLFVSGGDDFKIKVWNYKTCWSLFTLLGHLDYIRTVQFHHQHPWIVSASDDQTIRIWNWQSRTCISVLTGHNHYVMCATFHSKEDLVLSASLDQTVRVWDISALKKKKKKRTTSRVDDMLQLLSRQMDTYLFGDDVDDAVVKYVLEGHDRGVNWASFHPTLRLIVSGADDCHVKFWQMNDTKAWEVDTLRGHNHNVSCVMFHAKQDIIVSSSEDKSIRVWDAARRTCVQTFRREHDRFWILCAHPEMNLLAAGHDSGMIVFKLERERPAFAVSGDSLFYTTKDGFLRFYQFSTRRDTQVIPIRHPPGSTTRLLNQSPRTLSYSPAENAVLIFYSNNVDGGGSYELYVVPPKDSIISGGDSVVPKEEAKRGTGGGDSALFVARNIFAVLDRSSNQVLLNNLKNETVKKVGLPFPADAIFYAGTGKLLCRSEDRVYIFGLQKRLVLGELLTTPSFIVKYIVWSNDMESVALLSKHAIIIATKELLHQCTLHETIRVKGGAWDATGVFIYTTLTHIKYCFPRTGDNGTIKSIDVPMYMTKYSVSCISYLDRNGYNRILVIKIAEFLFKLCLLDKRYGHVRSMIKCPQLHCQAMVAYLQQKGYSEVALSFVKDERTRFNLALESGNIDIALTSANVIDEKEHWYRLGVEALRQGNKGIVEYCYQKTKNLERLSFLYLVTGDMDKLTEMLKIAQVNEKDVMGQFHNSLYLGDVRERVKILENVGQLPLAYITASVHGLRDVAERLAEELGDDNVPALPEGKQQPSLLMPPAPVITARRDWPLIPGVAVRGTFEGGLMDNVATEKEEEEDEEEFFCSSSLVYPPTLFDNLPQLNKKFELGCRALRGGKFSCALRFFRGLLQIIALIEVESRMEFDQVEALVTIVREYVLGLQMEMRRRELPEDNLTRHMELAAYFTHCKLQLPHLRLALQSAMNICYRGKNYSTAGNFGRRLLETNPTVSQAEQARQVVQQAKKTNTDAVQLNYDFRNPFVVCGATYEPIYQGQKYVSCPYCMSRFTVGQEGNLCAVCDLAVIGFSISMRTTKLQSSWIGRTSPRAYYTLTNI